METPAASDSELLTAWVEHRREPAFHALVARYATLVHMAAKRTCGDDSLAADASQLVFILLAQKAKSLTNHPTLAGWLHVTAVNKTRDLIDKARRESRKRQHLGAAMETHSSHSSSDVWKEMQPVLDDALAALSDKDREALLLRFYRSLSIREIAATLGIATDAAQKRVDRATTRLRGKLAKRGCVAGGTLAAVMLAGFATDAQAAALPVSLLASKALAAGTAATGILPGTTSFFKTLPMATTSFVAPLAVLLSAGIWIVLQRHSIATVEHESALLQTYLAANPTDADPIVKSNSKAKPAPTAGRIRWKDVALELMENRRNGDGANYGLWENYQHRVSAMSEADLTAALDEIQAPDMPAEGREMLERMFIEPLSQKLPEIALDRFRDRLSGKPDGVGWELPAAITAWAKKDPAAAAAWFDREVAAGTFISKSLSGENQILWKFQGFLLAVLMSSDPEAAALRVSEIPEKQREEVLSPLKFGAFTEEEQLAYANLVRASSLPEPKRVSLIAWRVEELPVDTDYSPVSGFLERIRATPPERSACVERAAQIHVEKLGDLRPITRQDLDQLRQWTALQAEGLTDRVTGNALGTALRTRNAMSFSTAAALALDYQKTSGTDEVILRLLDRWSGPDSADEAEALAGKIKDEKNRTSLLGRIAMIKKMK